MQLSSAQLKNSQQNVSITRCITVLSGIRSFRRISSRSAIFSYPFELVLRLQYTADNGFPAKVPKTRKRKKYNLATAKQQGPLKKKKKASENLAHQIKKTF